MVFECYYKLWQTNGIEGYKRLPVNLLESNILWLWLLSKIGLPQRNVLTNTSSGGGVNSGELLLKSFKKEIRGAE